jgi:hypothetical protein
VDWRLIVNTAVNGIHASPNQFTGREGPATGEQALHHSIQYARRAFAGSSFLPSGGRANERQFPVAFSAEANRSAGDSLYSVSPDLDPQRQPVGAGHYLPKHVGNLDMMT